ncbi:hypothetical protein GLAREA_03963 [Glarea lozoyensis ATCC 20868]|uniref:Uncharacterized protein n=1 Tax=Glarea lozoyensis (strain ATCC 20868 / MF5171) TaxID=1116229 RepID=S3DG60_GLAL2|nr:uncharacterized protein GLAREA_03963 [Glarea lozoyensis ATCC 20868]EPE30996.1 hypothetical protein GLAREA_03963 [Glarea lozoyensis ATCC 20868]
MAGYGDRNSASGASDQFSGPSTSEESMTLSHVRKGIAENKLKLSHAREQITDMNLKMEKRTEEVQQMKVAKDSNASDYQTMVQASLKLNDDIKNTISRLETERENSKDVVDKALKDMMKAQQDAESERQHVTVLENELGKIRRKEKDLNSELQQVRHDWHTKEAVYVEVNQKLKTELQDLRKDQAHAAHQMLVQDIATMAPAARDQMTKRLWWMVQQLSTEVLTKVMPYAVTTVARESVAQVLASERAADNQRLVEAQSKLKKSIEDLLSRELNAKDATIAEIQNSLNLAQERETSLQQQLDTMTDERNRLEPQSQQLQAAHAMVLDQLKARLQRVQEAHVAELIRLKAQFEKLRVVHEAKLAQLIDQTNANIQAQNHAELQQLTQRHTAELKEHQPTCEFFRKNSERLSKEASNNLALIRRLEIDLVAKDQVIVQLGGSRRGQD